MVIHFKYSCVHVHPKLPNYRFPRPSPHPPPLQPAVAMTTDGWSWSQDAVPGPHGAPLGPSMQCTSQQVCGGRLPWATQKPSLPGRHHLLTLVSVSWELASDFTKSSFRLSPGLGASFRPSSWKPTPLPADLFLTSQSAEKVSCCSSVAHLCPALCDTMDCSTPGFSVLHHLLELAQTPVY